MEVWTMWFFKQQCSNTQRQEEQGEQTPKGTRVIYLYSCGCVHLSCVYDLTFMFASSC